jgi:NTP pyrophosphatase (non-canonical NTP hydrolase)
MTITLNEYQELAMKTAIFPESAKYSYPALGLAGEAGEVANKAKKLIRDGATPEELEEKLLDIADELGDVLWYIAAMADACGVSLEHIAKANLHKLADRAVRGKLGGEGDKR